jgi:hypothetical protein
VIARPLPEVADDRCLDVDGRHHLPLLHPML